ncbi:MAG: CvpA family protein [Candidatus Nealsonbacteria bacterium]|nr:CvpA family protein [Candidatus Nealsonbacteria bacterium]
MWLTILMLVIFAACVGTLWAEGMWGNAVRLVNVVTAALLATNYFEPVADWLQSNATSYTYVCDFLALWGLFVIFMVIFRILTDRLSKVKVRFLKIADTAGSVFFSIWVGWMMVCFTMFSLHVAPLDRICLGDSFKPENTVLMFAPDRQWAAFVQKVSRGPFSRSASSQELAKRAYGVPPADDESEAKSCVFDRNGEFLMMYATRRARLGSYHDSNKGSIRVPQAKMASQYDQ